MYRLVFASLLLCIVSSYTLSDVNQQCIRENSESFSNDNLIGTWYIMYRFTLFGLAPSISCGEWTFTKPTADVVQQYRDRYSNADVPYNFDDNPVLLSDGYLVKDGLYTGHDMAKFFLLNWNTSMASFDRYSVETFRQLTPKYIMHSDCAMRGNVLFLLSNDRHAPVTEMEQLIKDTPQLNRLDATRYCATY